MGYVTSMLPKPVKVILVPLYRSGVFFYDLGMITVSLLLYLAFNSPSEKSHQAMIRLFCVTRGLSNDLISWFPKVFCRPYKLNFPLYGLAGCLSREKADQIKRTLDNDGYYIFDKPLDEQTIADILAFAETNPCRPRKSDQDDPNAPNVGPEEILNRAMPKATRYEYDADRLVNAPAIQKILNDETLLEIAQQYLGCKPTIDIVSMWWHTTAQLKPDSVAAQFYHFDMDRLKWLKIFINITEDNTDSGPHCFIKKSHRTFGIPWKFLKRGYARVRDHEIYDHYGKASEIEFCTKPGTILAEDTRGFHKGKHCVKGDRLLLEIQYSNCLFGAESSKMKLNATNNSSIMYEARKKHPHVYRLFV